MRCTVARLDPQLYEVVEADQAAGVRVLPSLSAAELGAPGEPSSTFSPPRTDHLEHDDHLDLLASDQREKSEGGGDDQHHQDDHKTAKDSLITFRFSP